MLCYNVRMTLNSYPHYVIYQGDAWPAKYHYPGTNDPPSIACTPRQPYCHTVMVHFSTTRRHLVSVHTSR